jgi:FtsH-binding integral membrane protein
MSGYLGYGGIGVADRQQAGTLFGQTMGYVAATAGFFTLGCYLGRNPSQGWAIVAFIAGFGATGYATRRDLSGLARLAFVALIVLIVLGIALIFVHIPHASLIYSVLGLVIFAVLTMADFQRLRRTKDLASAPLIAASIFLDVLNVFLFFLRIFAREN